MSLLWVFSKLLTITLKKHLDDPVPNADFPELRCLDIGSSVSGISSDQIGKYMSKI